MVAPKDDSIDKIVNGIIKLQSGYLTECEKRQTQHEQTMSKLRQNISALRAYNEAARLYFETQMAERKYLFDLTMQVIDCAIAHNDAEMVKMNMQFLKDIRSKVPFSF